MPEPFMESPTPIHHPCCWELTNQPARIKLPQTLSSVAGSFIQFDRKIHQNPDSIKCIRNYLGISGVEEATAVYKFRPASSFSGRVAINSQKLHRLCQLR